MLDYKKILNSEQYKAVQNINGATLILAGAGSGKTRVITFKILYLIENGIEAEKILAVTFTNKAANEMRLRVSELYKNKKKQPLITTFHSLGLKILKEQITKIGYKDKFSIYDDKDCQKIIKDIIIDLKIPDDKYDVYNLGYEMSHIKMNLGNKSIDEEVRKIYSEYQRYLKLHNAVDFDDLIKLPIELFKKHPEVLEIYQKKWKHILVDEYQDTSSMQYEIMKLLSINHKNISIVGDDDQSIYSWRGANATNFAMFENDFYPVCEVRLEQNYRSKGNILKAANSIIIKNPNRKDKKLWTNEDNGEKLEFFEAKDEKDEVNTILTIINKLVNDGYHYKDIGILYRTNSLSTPVEEVLRECAIPYKVVGEMKFFDRPEIRDMLSYIRFLANKDDEVALIRIINNPKRGIGNTTLHAVMEFSKENNCSLFATIKQFVSTNYLGSKSTPYLEDFLKLIEKYTEMIYKPKNISRTVSKLVEEIDYKGKLVTELKQIKKVTYRLNNINSLLNSITRYENNPDNFNPNVFDYIQRITLANKDDEKDDKDNIINMMSIHSAKGLEFKIVFLVGVEEGVIPHSKTLEETGNDEEERRLFYVAITRAREKLYMSYPKTRIKFNEILNREISKYVSEIPADVIEILDLEKKLEDTDPMADLLLKWNKN